MYIYILIFVLLVIAFFDVYWILRLILTRLLSKVGIFLLVEMFWNGFLLFIASDL